MNVPFFELGRLVKEQESEISEAIIRVVKSGWYILGKECSTFENQLKNSLHAKNSTSIVGCNSGTDAITLALLTAKIGKGDEVIAPSQTAVPTISAIVATGATPVLVDIDPNHWVIDVEKIKAALSPSTRAVIAVHLYGNMADISALRRMLDQQKRDDIQLIEDVAQAHGASWEGSQAGTLGDFGTFSFYPSKNIGALGDGGALATTRSEDTEIAKMLRFYGQKSRYDARIPHGINSRLDEIQAAVLSVRLNKLEEWNNRKNSQMKIYAEAFSSLPIKMQKVHASCKPAWHLAVIKLENQQTRDALKNHLEMQKVETMIHYPIPNHLQTAFDRVKKMPCPITEELASCILSLPMNAGLRDTEQHHVIQSVRNFFGK